MATVPVERLKEVISLITIDPPRAADILSQLMDEANHYYNNFVPLPKHVPSCSLEIFTRSVLPVPAVLDVNTPGKLALLDMVHWAKSTKTSPIQMPGGHTSKTISIKHSPLQELIEQHVSAVINGELPAHSPTVMDFNRRYAASYEAVMKAPAGEEDDSCATALYAFASSINSLLADRAVFKSGTVEEISPKWRRLKQNARPRISTWVCEGVGPRAVMEWQGNIAVETGGLAMLWCAALQSELKLILEDDGTIRKTTRVKLDPFMMKVMFQLWGQAHQRRCRWMLLSNTESAMACYLADADTVWISKPIARKAGLRVPNVTLATFLFGVALRDMPAPEGAARDIVFNDSTESIVEAMEPDLEPLPADLLAAMVGGRQCP